MWTGPTPTARCLAAWYLDRQAVAERVLLLRSFGVEELWLADWNDSVAALLETPAAPET